MAIDFTKPSTSDNYSTAFVPNIQDNVKALAQWLDSTQTTITGTPPTYAKRYNRSSTVFEEYNGSAWVALPVGYAPLTGGGTSGTWGINISGSAGAVPWSGVSSKPTITTLTADMAASANTVVQRDASADVFVARINQNSANAENPTLSQFMVTNGSDNTVRKASLAFVSAGITPTWANVSGKPTAVSYFTNDSGYATLASPAFTGTPTHGGIEIGYRRLPAASVTTGAFVAADSGKCVNASAGVTVPNSTMAAGDVVSIYNNTASAITITASITTLRFGTAGSGNRTLGARGMCTCYFIGSTEAVIQGSGLT